MADAGVASRRKSEELIAAGAVRVNNRVAKIGDSVNPAKDTVTVRGKRIFRAGTMRYILLNKPRGYVTTTDDDLGRKCVTQLLPDVKERVYPDDADDKSVSWNSADPDIASVDENGLVTGLSRGTASISVTAKGSGQP